MKKSTKTAIIIAVAVIGGAAVIGAVTGQNTQKSPSETSGTSTSSVASVSSNVKSNDDNNTEISLEKMATAIPPALDGGSRLPKA